MTRYEALSDKWISLCDGLRTVFVRIEKIDAIWEDDRTGKTMIKVGNDLFADMRGVAPILHAVGGAEWVEDGQS
jgi:hypothetical protein